MAQRCRSEQESRSGPHSWHDRCCRVFGHAGRCEFYMTCEEMVFQQSSIARLEVEIDKLKSEMVLL
jgi:hypothetical protein